CAHSDHGPAWFAYW
nr:immunoglobulin heavy chain junction region [Mus musculus]